MGIEFVTQWMDKIPTVIEFIRNFIIKIIETLNLPIDTTYAAIIGIIALFLSYKWIKQWVTTSLFYKVSTIINWILLALLLYVLFVYV